MKNQGRSVISYLVFGILTLGAIAACSEEKETLNTPDSYEYFPLEVGKYWVYEVDSILFKNQTLRDSSTTWVKEQIIDYIIDNAGDTVYRVDQYDRKDTTQPWKIRRVVSLSRNATRAIRTEENISLIKMVFPLHRRGTWNSTVLTDPSLMINVGGKVEIFKYWRSEVESIDEPFTDGNINYPETTTILHAEKDASVEIRFAKEIYAKHMGLVWRGWQILDCNSTQVDCFNLNLSWDKKATSGFIIQQRLIEYN